MVTPEEFSGWSDITDFIEAEDGSSDITRLDFKDRVAGHHAYPGDAQSSELLTSLVKTQLVPTVENRPAQFGVYPFNVRGDSEFRVNTFLRGPNELVIAGSYVRPNQGSVWFIPHDVDDLEPWWTLALHDWHEIFPERFPGVPKWQNSPDWMTHIERAIQARIQDEVARFAPLQQAHDAELARLRTDFDIAQTNASKGARVLLTGQDDELQNAVLQALLALGYTVRDMDEVWPDRERREDYRITEDGYDDWLVLADATGVSKGAKASKFQILGRNVTKYVFEEKPNFIPRQWLIVNRLIERDPATRGDIFRPDELGPLSESLCLAFDTAALFVLQDAVAAGAVSGKLVREMLRERTGQLRLEDAREWLNRQEP
ncbi:hypothetical protein [Rhodococcus sp. 21391]|uniref:Uncharacterized protein n=1 Tax=Rhodococcus opacus RKJ300 = JCM 13270 TaxID=1165867 RepID=I0WWM4_RHOOP|nr:hypothetical protein [Rhodococcus sp. 21391]EID80790.1 hypothetical protein W59_06268 [Rhodococcus opacus RKJ300 = JCM 13270]QQZ15234.1 hypothetical protein GO592_03215 [Rhodococcus sp. 21391]